MELRQLLHFLAIAEERHFTRAAAKLHLSQPSLSASIRSLEKELHSTLLIRNSRRVELTEAGRALLPAARRALSAVEEGQAAVDAVQGVLRGSLTIGCIQFLGVVDLPSLLVEYHHRYPGITISVIHDSVDSLMESIGTGELDLAIVDRPLDPRTAHMQALGSETLVLAVASDDPLAKQRKVSLEQLQSRDFVEFRADSSLRVRLDAVYAAEGLQRRICCEIDDIAELVKLVSHGLGIALVPPGPLEDVAGVVGVEIEPAIARDLVLATPADRPESPSAKAFLQLLSSQGNDIYRPNP
ncbi:LysR family transcriptional regulator [Glutamicibacter sp.]|uniref:LysR family transcriptional regulator n=1 Tax=Glutamicibacter sp. TaxID=1931995 RepID=UPI0028BEE757|nr:LysR family transcriptional regulator [Glutamicibacter sp.]